MRALSLHVDDMAALSAEILAQGHAFCFRARGSSMVPFIHDGDLLTVQPSSGAVLRVGDVALYRARGDRLAAHRVIALRAQGGRALLTVRGDASAGPGEPLSPDQLLGRVVQVQRGDRTLDLDRRTLRLGALLWVTTAPLGPWLLGGLIRLKQHSAWLLRSPEL